MAGMPEILVGRSKGIIHEILPHLRQTCVLCFILAKDAHSAY